MILMAEATRRPARRALAEFIAAKGTLRVYEAVLCACAWLEREMPNGVTGAAIEAWYPSHDGRRLRGTATMLRRLVRFGLVTRDTGACYRVTPLGHALVDALPERDIAVAVIGTRPPARRAE